MGRLFAVISWLAVVIVVISWATNGLIGALVLFFLLSALVGFFLT